MDRASEVVITGVGVVSPIGIGKDAFGRALSERRSGVVALTELNGRVPEFRFGGVVGDCGAKQYVKPRKALKVMCHEIQMAYVAAELGMQDAALATGSVDPDRFGVVMGTDLFYCPPDELEAAYRGCVGDGRFDYDLWADCAMKDVNPLWMLKHLPNMAACQIGIAQDARGPNNSITLGEVSSLLAICEAASLIERGWADVMIAGGASSRLSLTPMIYRGAAKLSRYEGEPAEAARPFDARRQGLVNGEGAGVVVLESRRYAEARGAKPLARIPAWSRSYGASPNAARRSKAVEQSIAATMQAARFGAQDIGHVNAHGIGTIDDDPIEAAAIAATLGEVPVTAPKSFFGHLGAGGGAVELAASILALETGEVPVTLNYEQPDPACPINVIHKEPLRGAAPAALVLNQAETGQAVALAIAAP